MDSKTKEITNYENLSYSMMKSQLKSLNSNSSEDEKCSICQYDFTLNDSNIVKLSQCIGHYFHEDCISQSRQQKAYLKCPNCLKVYGTQVGEMPSGTMTVSKKKGRVPGFNCQFYIEIKYDIPTSKIKGKTYKGTLRTAYLPDTTEGNHALTLLTLAFQRGLTFMPGTSITTGLDGIIWALHHKTDLYGTEYSYPDPTYLKRLSEELDARGVRFD